MNLNDLPITDLLTLLGGLAPDPDYPGLWAPPAYTFGEIMAHLHTDPVTTAALLALCRREGFVEIRLRGNAPAFRLSH